MERGIYISRNCQHDRCETCLDKKCKCICHPIIGADVTEPFTAPANPAGVKLAELFANALSRR